jgi:hypothetical protein
MQRIRADKRMEGGSLPRTLGVRSAISGQQVVEDDSEPFEEKMARLTATLEAQFAESARLEANIRENLGRLEE